MHSFATPNDSRSGQLSELFPEGNGLSILCVRHRRRRCAHGYADPIRLQRVLSALVRSGGKTVVSQRRDEDIGGPVTSLPTAFAYANWRTNETRERCYCHPCGSARMARRTGCGSRRAPLRWIPVRTGGLGRRSAHGGRGRVLVRRGHSRADRSKAAKAKRDDCRPLNRGVFISLPGHGRISARPTRHVAWRTERVSAAIPKHGTLSAPCVSHTSRVLFT